MSYFLVSLSNDLVTLDSIAQASSTTVRNHNVIFDQDMSFNFHTKQTSRTAPFPPYTTLQIKGPGLEINNIIFSQIIVIISLIIGPINVIIIRIT